MEEELKRGEISYNERDCALVHSAIGCLEPIADRDWDGKWRIKKALAFLSQVGDTPTREPVADEHVTTADEFIEIISRQRQRINELEAPTKPVSGNLLEWLRDTLNNYCPHVWEECPQATEFKATLDAAGVKYVD